MVQKSRHMLRDLDLPRNFEGVSRWSRIEIVACPIHWLGNMYLSLIIQLWSGFCKFWLIVMLHFVCAGADCFCLNHPLLDIIVVVVCISWTDGIMWLNWSSQVWREKLKRPIKNSALSPTNTPNFKMFCCIFTERPYSTTVWDIQIFIYGV